MRRDERRVRNIQEPPDKPLGTQERQQSEQSKLDSARYDTLLGNSHADEERAKKDAGQAPDKAHNPHRRRAKELLRSHRFRQFCTDPKMWFEFAALVVLGLYTNYTRLTLNEIQSQVQLAESANRPWLRISEIRLDDSLPNEPVLSFMPIPTIKPMNGANLRVEFVIKNIGKGVAKDVFVSPNIVFEKWDATDPDRIAKAQKSSCEFWEKVQFPQGGFSWSALFPGDEVRSRVGIAAPFSDEVVSHLPNKSGSYLAGALIGCVTYQYPRAYQTRVVYYILGERDRFIEVGKPLNESHIRLMRDPHYEFAQ